MPKTTVQNSGSVAVTFILKSEVFDPAGVLVGATNISASLLPGTSYRWFQEVLLSGTVQLWNTATRPPLYTVHSTLLVGGAAVDSVVTKIGIRSAVWTPTSGFQLNGARTPVHGEIHLFISQSKLSRSSMGLFHRQNRSFVQHNNECVLLVK
jgi:beta-galactosidase